jgi:hypothetical protein
MKYCILKLPEQVQKLPKTFNLNAKTEPDRVERPASWEHILKRYEGHNSSLRVEFIHLQRIDHPRAAISKMRVNFEHAALSPGLWRRHR